MATKRDLPRPEMAGNEVTERTRTALEKLEEMVDIKAGSGKTYLDAQFEKTAKRKLTEAEAAEFSMFCTARKLTPFKHAYAFPQEGKICICIGVTYDGWLKLLKDDPTIDGIKTESFFKDDGTVYSAKTTIWIKGWTHPVEKTIYYQEWVRGRSPRWNDMPIHMMELRSICQTARIAVPLDNVVDMDEISRRIELGIINVDRVAFSAENHGWLEDLAKKVNLEPPVPSGTAVPIEMASKGTSSASPSIPAAPQAQGQGREVQASRKAFGFAKGTFGKHSGDETMFEQFLAYKKMSIPLSMSNCSKLLDAWSIKDKDGNPKLVDISDIKDFMASITGESEAEAETFDEEAPESPAEAEETITLPPTLPPSKGGPPGASEGLFDIPPADLEARAPETPDDWPFGITLPKDTTAARKLLLEAQGLCVRSALAHGYDEDAPVRAIKAWHGIGLHQATLAQLKELFEKLKSSDGD